MCNFDIEKAKEYYEKIKDGMKRRGGKMYETPFSKIKDVAYNLDTDISSKSGAYKLVIVFEDYDFVLKFGDNSFFEMYIYDDLMENGYESICEKLAENIFLGYIEKIPVFAQEKVAIVEWADEVENEDLLQNYREVYRMIYDENVDEDEIEETSLADFQEKSDFLNNYIFNNNMETDCYKWVKEYEDIYGSFEHDFYYLQDRYELYDWHSGNLGYRDGMPIIIDYAGYENAEWLVEKRDEYIKDKGFEYKEEV